MKESEGDSMESETRADKILLIVFASIAAAVSLFLLVIYALLAVSVIGYAVAPEQAVITGWDAAASAILIIVVLVGLIITFLGGTAVFVGSLKASGRTKAFVKITFIYHASAVALAIITLILTQILG